MAAYVIMCNDVPMHVFKGPHDECLVKIEELAHRDMMSRRAHWMREALAFATRDESAYDYYRKRQHWREYEVPLTNWYEPNEED